MSIIARTIAGFAVAPLVPGALIAGMLLGAGERDNAQELILVNVFFGYPIALLIGVPLFLFLRQRGWNGLAVYVLTGAVLGALLYVAIPVLLESLMLMQGLDASGHVTFSLSVLPVAIICTTVAAASLWLIVRPDRG